MRVVARKEDVNQQITEVARLKAIYRSRANSDDRVLWQDGNGKLEDRSEELRDAQYRVKDIERKILGCDFQVKRSKQRIKDYSLSMLRATGEVKLFATNAVRPYLKQGINLPLKKCRAKKSGEILRSPGANSSIIYRLHRGELIYVLATTGPWYITILENRSVGWIR